MISVASKSIIGFDKPGLLEADNYMLLKTAAFIVLDEKNMRSRQPVTVYDEVYLKSVMGTFIICEAGGEVSIKGT
jgi:hypothetical protein